MTLRCFLEVPCSLGRQLLHMQGASCVKLLMCKAAWECWEVNVPCGNPQEGRMGVGGEAVTSALRGQF